MSLGERLWHLARRRLRASLGLLQGEAFRRPDGHAAAAREELDAYLRAGKAPDAGRAPSGPPPGGSSRAEAGRHAQTGRNAAHPPPHPCAADYAFFGLPVGADPAAVRDAWRRVVRESHPDRFPGDPAAQQRAAERLRRANEAYRRLRRFHAGAPPRP